MSIGIDIVEIHRIREAIRRHGGRFCKRIYTSGEIAYCEARAKPEEHFAARFAVKEAVAKALRSDKEFFIRWRDVEVVSENWGAPRIALHGETSKRFDESKLSISISHSTGQAVAVAHYEG